MFKFFSLFRPKYLYLENKWILDENSTLNKSQLRLIDKTTKKERESIYTFLNEINDLFVSHQGYLRGSGIYKTYKKNSLYYINSCLELSCYIVNVILQTSKTKDKHLLFLEVFSICKITFLHKKYNSLLDDYMSIDSHRLNFYTKNDYLLFPNSSFDYEQLFFLFIHKPLQFKGENITMSDTMEKINDIGGFSHTLDTKNFVDYVSLDLNPSIDIIVEKYFKEK